MKLIVDCRLLITRGILECACIYESKSPLHTSIFFHRKEISQSSASKCISAKNVRWLALMTTKCLLYPPGRPTRSRQVGKLSRCIYTTPAKENFFPPKSVSSYYLFPTTCHNQQIRIIQPTLFQVPVPKFTKVRPPRQWIISSELASRTLREARPGHCLPVSHVQ